MFIDPSLPKQYWLERGWTKEILIERMKVCRVNQKKYQNYPDNTRYDFRFFNAVLYLKYKKLYQILSD